MPKLPTGTVTFLFTDIEGSTRLWQEWPDAMGSALARHDELLRRAIAASDGYVIKGTGDGICAVFNRAYQAVEAAIAAQTNLQREVLPVPLSVRMAIHTGEAEERRGDYFGPTLNRTSRLMGAGHGGQVLLSTATREILADTELDLADLGQHRLRDLTRPEHIYQLRHPGLLATFPPLRSLDTHPHNLPVQLTRFVGRESEVRRVSELLAGARLVTLSGIGGVGKTRLATQVAAEVLDSYADGAWLVELAPISAPGLVVTRAAEPFGVRDMESTGSSGLVDVLAAYLADKHLLLVLDNCEHVLEASGDLAEHLLTRCPRITILATSRELLGIPGEVVYSLPPLSLSATDSADIEESEAVLLFTDRAAQVHPGFVLSDDNALAVGEIAMRLEGLPLAIELAASRTNLLTPQQISQLLEDQGRLLASSRHDRGRHRTLEATMDWSYELLSGSERSLFRTLAVFAGGWDLEAAEAICDVSGVGVLDNLGRLVDQSLVSVSDVSGERRYRLLEPVRQYALIKLRESGKRDSTRRRHAEYFLEVAEASEAELRGPGQDAWTRRIDREHDNLRTAMQWSLDKGQSDLALRLVAALGWFWWLRGYWGEAQDWFQRVNVATVEADPILRARAVYKVAGLEVQKANPSAIRPLLEAIRPTVEDLGTDLDIAWWNTLMADATPDIEQSMVLAEDSIRHFSAAGDNWGEAMALYQLGTYVAAQRDSEQGLSQMRHAIDTLVGLGDRLTAGWLSFNLGHSLADNGQYEEARQVIENTLALVEGTEDRWVAPHCKSRLAVVAIMTGNREEARRLSEEALPVHQRIGDRSCTALVHNVLGEVFTEEGNFASARDHLTLALEGFNELQNPFRVARSLRRMAWLAAAEQNLQRATRLLGAAEALRESVGGSLPVHDRERTEAVTASLKVAVEPERFAGWWASGAAMSMDDAVEFARS